MSRRSAKERLTQHMPVEHHFSQVDKPMSKFGMHFYGANFRVYNGQLSECIMDCPYHTSAFQIRTLSEFQLMFHAVRCALILAAFGGSFAPGIHKF